jgi:hypothetical protein
MGLEGTSPAGSKFAVGSVGAGVWMTAKKLLIASHSDGRCCNGTIEEELADHYQIAHLFADGARESSASVIKQLLNADLLICRSWAPEALYVLGIAHAVGIPTLFVSDVANSSGLDVSDWNVNIIDKDAPDWRERLIGEIERLIQGGIVSPKPVVAHGSKSAPINLSNEIRSNLLRVEEVKAKDLIFLGVWHEIKQGSFPVITCDTEVYESYSAQVAREKASPDLRSALRTLYDKFYEVNARSSELVEDFRPETAQAYLKSVRLLEDWHLHQCPGILDELMDLGY